MGTTAIVMIIINWQLVIKAKQVIIMIAIIIVYNNCVPERHAHLSILILC